MNPICVIQIPFSFEEDNNRICDSAIKKYNVYNPGQLGKEAQDLRRIYSFGWLCRVHSHAMETFQMV